MRLLTGRNHHATARTSRRGSTLALDGARFTQLVRGFTAAYGEPDPPGSRQAGFFLFFKSPGGIGIGRRRDLDIITCVELNITLTHHRRALQQKIILCQHLNLISA